MQLIKSKFVMPIVVPKILAHLKNTVNTGGSGAGPSFPKLRVAGSNPVFRSSPKFFNFPANAPEIASNRGFRGIVIMVTILPAPCNKQLPHDKPTDFV